MLQIKQNYIRFIISFNFLIVLYSCSHVQPFAHAGIKYFESLEKRLVADGFDKNRIRKIYNDSRILFETRGVSAYFVHHEGKLNYDQFTEPYAIERAFDYMETYKTELINAEMGYGVDRRVITAIISVETGFGTYVGKRLVLNTLSTMASLADPMVRNALWEKVSNSTDLTKAQFEEKADKKSEWAYNELKEFLKYTGKENIEPLDIYGSYAGAMGICQFIPSNILTLARDGNKDGKIDLFNHADAIMSVASYLNHYGWYSGINAKDAYNVVYAYNHSDYYVNTILKIADLLRGNS